MRPVELLCAKFFSLKFGFYTKSRHNRVAMKWFYTEPSSEARFVDSLGLLAMVLVTVHDVSKIYSVWKIDKSPNIIQQERK